MIYKAFHDLATHLLLTMLWSFRPYCSKHLLLRVLIFNLPSFAKGCYLSRILHVYCMNIVYLLCKSQLETSFSEVGLSWLCYTKLSLVFRFFQLHQSWHVTLCFLDRYLSSIIFFMTMHESTDFVTFRLYFKHSRWYLTLRHSMCEWIHIY